MQEPPDDPASPEALVVPPSAPQQLGPNWRPQQIGYWRMRGFEAVGPTATELLFHVMDGVESIHDLRDRTGLSTSCVQGHVRRLTGLGLVQWTCKRGDPILPLVEFVTNVWDVLEDEPNDSCAVESTQLD